MAWGDLAVEGQTLSPLPANLKSGLTAITLLAFISFFSSCALFFYLSYKLVSWQLFLKDRRASQVQQQTGSLQKAIDFTLGIDGIFTDENNNDTTTQGTQPGDADVQHAPRQPNQFLILIINLLLADMHQGVAFFLNVEWLRRGAIVVDTPTCFTQGLFVSLGDLSSSMFITAIAVHTYLAVVKRRRVGQGVLYLFIAAIWVFVYAISFLPIAATRGGAEYGGFFVRAGSWCWMNKKYENLRLFTHYLWIFIALAVTSLLYTGIFLSIRRQARADRNVKPDDDGDSTQLRLNYNPAFLIYPVIYVLCTLPLAMGRIATMAGANVPLGYFCFAGAMIASNGSFDCLLFGTTRNVILFASKYEVDTADLGLKTFNFMKTPTNRRFGNVISIQGGRQRSEDNDGAVGGWWTWSKRGGGSDPRGRKGMTRTTSQESLRGPAIHMDMVTSVVVEVDDSKDRDPRYPDPASSASPSVTSTDKDFPSVITRRS
ncbi:hypothetical protein EDB81DRAFT_503282 [Dactylonectria macrodidyma]|uniref:G-protein coupled receptors family 1 profile domain-containing protein n=1 Tax=Dactylonectria macrodidyma TaxID=307937 RepID=A0A9P9J4J4_9HYPO|nr:hypothetical protein EDB81DRAFT_503282 [Dactylonectria macrodidyma]